MTWRSGEAGSTLIDRPKDAPVPDFTNGKERDTESCRQASLSILSSNVVDELSRLESD